MYIFEVQVLSLKAFAKSFLVLAIIALPLSPISATAAPSISCEGAYCTATFSYTGGSELWTIPGGITSITVDVRGASGGIVTNASYPSISKAPGYGAKVLGTFAVTAEIGRAHV